MREKIAQVKSSTLRAALRKNLHAAMLRSVIRFREEETRVANVPLYEYRCVKCGHRFEKIEKVTASEIKKCPKCGAKAERMAAAPAIQFKGSGWYVTDYAGKNSDGTSKDSKEAKESKEAKDSKAAKESPASKTAEKTAVASESSKASSKKTKEK